jgi:hypothetical protein
VGAAVKRAARFNAVADHLAATVLTNGCQFVNRTLEAVEGVRLASCNDLECQLVVVSTNLARGHVSLSGLKFKAEPAKAANHGCNIRAFRRAAI